jgi:hypothetical protein
MMTPQDRKTTSHAIEYRITQEMKVLHKKKQNLNSQMYYIHLKCTDYCNSIRQHIEDSTEAKIKKKMDTLYSKLNNKLNTLITETTTTCTDTKNRNTHAKIINLTDTTFNHEHLHTLSLGPNYAIEKDPKHYINDLITDTENAIRHLDPKIQNTFRHMATKKIKQIITTNRLQATHKRHQHNLNQIKDTLQKGNLTLAKADKNRAIVIINKTKLERKVQTFIQENGITLLPKDPTDQFHKQIQQALQRCNTLVEKNQHKFLLNIKPTAPQLNAYIKTHKEGEAISPVINNTHAPSFKTAKFLNKNC